MTAENEVSLLPFVPVDKKSTRAEITRKMGSPHAEFEGGRIWAYRFTYKGREEALALTPRSEVVSDRSHAVTAWKHSHYSLVLIFNGNVLNSHSLVRVR